MELLTSLPPDLAVFADPSARGPAPLLRSPDGDGARATAATPFELCLALLTADAPGGETWPAAGKELPGLPLEAEAASDAAAALANPLLAFAPMAFAQGVPTTWPSLERASQPGLLPTAAALPLPLPTESAIGPSPDSNQPPTGALAPQTLADLDPLALLAPGEAEPTPVDAAQQAASTTAKTAPAPSWLEAFTAREARLQRPLAATPAELRAAAAPASAATAAAPVATNQPLAATAVVEPSLVAQSAGRRNELSKTLVSTVTAAESPSASRAEWLPPAAGHGAATSAAAAPTTSPPGAPVDLRSPNWQEALANRVQWLVDTQVGEAHIKLSPPELGALDVKISLIDDKTFVQLTTATAAARDELAHSLPRLRELFASSGLELGGASVHNGRDGQQSGHGYSADRAATTAAPFAAFAADLDDLPAFAPRHLLGRIDVFA